MVSLGGLRPGLHIHIYLSGVNHRTLVSGSASDNLQRDKIQARSVRRRVCVVLGPGCERHDAISSRLRERGEALRLDKTARCKQGAALDGLHFADFDTLYHNGGVVFSHLLHHEEITTAFLQQGCAA